MATKGGSRDAKLTLSVEALGQENIATLEQELRKLAATGENGSEEFAAFADQIAELGKQAQALTAVKELANSTEQLSQEQQRAKGEVSVLSAELVELKAATDAARNAERSASQQRADNTAQMVAQRNAQRALKVDLRDGTLTTDEYNAKLRESVSAYNAAAAKVDELKVAHREAKDGLRDAVAEQNKANTALERAEKVYGTNTQALNDQNLALQAAATAANRLGVDTSNLATAETRLQSLLIQTVQASRNRKEALDEMAEATRLHNIQEAAMAQLLQRGQAALHAEELAMRDAARVAEQYAAAKARIEADAAVWQREATQIVEAAKAAMLAGQATDVYLDQLNQLSKNNAWAEQAKDAQSVVRVRDYVRAWSDELAAANQRLKTVNDAFRTLNVRPLEQIQAEIRAITSALNTAATSGKLTGGALTTAANSARTQIAALEREARELNGTLTIADKTASLFKNSLGQIAAGNLVADGVGYLVNKVKEMGREFFKANLDLDRLQRTMTQITGSSQGAAEKIQFLREVADTAGVAVGRVTDSFIKFQASASASGIAAEEVDAIFKSVTVSGSRMGMSSDRVSLALDALSQVAGKGVLSMEELRSQLAESLPGAVAIAARGLDMTIEQLTKLVSTGQITAQQFFPAFRKGLEESFGSSDTKVLGLLQSVERLGNKFTQLYQKALDSAAFSLLGKTIDGITASFDTLVVAIGALGRAFVALKLVEFVRNLNLLGGASKAAAADVATQTAATAANTTATTANSAAKAVNVVETGKQTLAVRASAAAMTAATAAQTAYAAAMGRLATAARSLFTALGGLPGLLVAVVANADTLGKWLGESVAKFTAAGRALQVYEQQVKLQAAAEKAAAQSRAEAARLVADTMQKEMQAQMKVREGLADKERAAKEAVEAENLRAQVLQRTADLYGNQSQSLQAAVQASQMAATAAASEANVKREYVQAMQVEIEQRRALIALTKDSSQASKDELEKLEAKLATKQEELKQSAAAAEMARLETAERQIAAAAYEDNAAKVDTFRQSMEGATAEVARLKAMIADGQPVHASLTQAQLNLAAATRMYTDAVKDNAEAVNAKMGLQRAESNLTLQTLQGEKARYEVMARTADAERDYATALYAKVEAKRVEIQMVEASARAKRIEANTEEEMARNEMAELQRTGQLNEAKRLELETRITNAKVKMQEANASASLVEGLEREIQALQRLGNGQRGTNNAVHGNTRAMADNTSERERSIASREKEIQLMEREKALQDNLRQGSGTMHSDFGTRTGIVNFLKQAGVDNDAVARRIANEFADANGNVQYINNPGQLKYGGRYGSMSDALMKAAEQYTFGGGKSADTATSEAAAPNSSKTVNVTIGGRKHTIRTATDTDSNNLVSMLRNLENQGNTAV